MVIIVMGLPGSGKSYFASRLATAIGAKYISSDSLRKGMIWERTYSAKEKDQVYEKMRDEMLKEVRSKKSVVLDATFYRKEIRRRFTGVVRSPGEIVFIEVVADESLIKQRVSKPRKDSDADFSVYKIIEAEWEPLEETHLVLRSTNINIEEMLQKALAYLRIKK